MANVNVRFDLLNEETVKVLAQDSPNLLPRYDFRDAKDFAWNQRHLAAVLQDGVLSGSSTQNISRDLSRVTDMNMSTATRITRTAMTSASNQGRMDSYEHAASLGIKGKIMWLATIDERTRDTHAVLDGELIELGGEFSNGLKFPGDPAGEPEEVYNCRCTTTFEVVGMNEQMLNERKMTFWDGSSRIGGKTYEEWKRERAEEIIKRGGSDDMLAAAVRALGGSAVEKIEYSTATIVEGSDIAASWNRRMGEYEFAVEDVMAVQGFDGTPQVVGKEQFDSIVAENNVIAQRAYRAPTKEVLDEYQSQLYSGKWYVDCSNGGSAYGRGMYASAEMDVSISERMARTMDFYRNIEENSLSIVETFTMVNPKIATYSDIEAGLRAYREANNPRTLFIDNAITNVVSSVPTESREAYTAFLNYEVGHRNVDFNTLRGFSDYVDMNEVMRMKASVNESLMNAEKSGVFNKAFNELANFDEGAFAAMKGYDAIYVEENGYMVVLNRTKVVFLGGKN